jgi:hypothetical protein
VRNPIGFLLGRLREGATPPELPDIPPPLSDKATDRYKPAPTYYADQDSIWTPEERRNRNAPPAQPSEKDASDFSSLKAMLAKDPTVIAHRNRGKSPDAPPVPGG